MLLQSHLNEIQLLPALPDVWAAGSVKGLRVRGGFAIDMDWSDHQIKKLKIYSTTDTVCRLRFTGNSTPVTLIPIKKTGSDKFGNTHEFQSQKNRSYLLTFK